MLCLFLMFSLKSWADADYNPFKEAEDRWKARGGRLEYTPPPKGEQCHYPRRVKSLEKPYQAGQRFKDCPTCPEMVVLPRGTFKMGALAGAWNSYHALPAHTVTLKYWFAAGRFEVTQAEWNACARAGYCEKPKRYPNHRGPKSMTLDGSDLNQITHFEGWARCERRAMYGVSRREADDFVKWLRHKTGKPYRLLSEAEWEYAARGGTVTPYYWGEEIVINAANSKANESRWAKPRYQDGVIPAPVGSFKPNPFGLYDILGNVNEWVSDCREPSYEGAPNDGRAWQLSKACFYVLRDALAQADPKINGIALHTKINERSMAYGMRVGLPLP